MKPITIIVALLFCSGAAEYVSPEGYLWTQSGVGSIELSTDTGYKIAGTVLNAQNFDIENGNYAVIRADGEGKEDGIRFSYSVPKKYQFLIGTDKATAEVVTGGDIRILFKRIGDEPPTTIPSPSTEIPFPTPAANESKSLTVYLSGRRPSDYANKDLLNKLKTDILNMAKEYCSTQGFVLIKDITENNVRLERLTYCPDSWADHETCAQLKFSLPIDFDEGSSRFKGYQLSTAHLEIMWKTLADKYFVDFNVYDEPDIEKLNIIWYVAISLLIVAFIALLVVSRSLILWFLRMLRKWGDSDEKDIPEIWNNNEDNKRHLQAHYIIETPENFDDYVGEGTENTFTFENKAYEEDI